MRKIALILFGMIGLSTTFAVDQITNNVPLRTLAKGAMSGITTATHQVITNQSRWEDIWKRHGLQLRSEAEAPKIDFNKEMVLFATLGQKTTGGYGIEITHAEVSEGRLRVFIGKKSPPPGAMTLQALTAPFHVAAVPKSDLPVEWVF